jgi:hypothetical protein
MIHHATITAAEGSALFYRVGDTTGGGSWSQVVGPVHMGPKRGGGLATFAAFGDMGTYSYAPHATVAATSPQGLGSVDDKVAASLLRAAPTLDATFHVGDIAYANDGSQVTGVLSFLTLGVADVLFAFPTEPLEILHGESR